MYITSLSLLRLLTRLEPVLRACYGAGELDDLVVWVRSAVGGPTLVSFITGRQAA